MSSVTSIYVLSYVEYLKHMLIQFLLEYIVSIYHFHYVAFVVVDIL